MFLTQYIHKLLNNRNPPENVFITISTVNCVNSGSVPVYPSEHLSLPPVLSGIPVAQFIVSV